MGFDEFEESVDDGQPVECFTFSNSNGLLLQQTTSLELVVLGDTREFEPAAISRSGIVGSSDLAADAALTIECSPQHEIAQMHVLSVPTAPIQIQIEQVQRDDEDVEVVGLWLGYVRSVTFSGNSATIHCTPIPGIKREGLSPGLTRPCRYYLYDQHTCKVNRELFTLTGTIASIDGITITAAVFATQPDGWLSGGNAIVGDQTLLITSHEGDTITLLLPFADASVGGAITAEAGCDRLKITCKDKFNNLLNHGGFAWLPDKNPFQIGVEG